MNVPASRSRRQVSAATGVPIGVLRSLEADGLLSPGNLTEHDEVLVRALTWADGARGGDREHERRLAEQVRVVLAEGQIPAELTLVLIAEQVVVAQDYLEALVLLRGRRGPVTLLPLGKWAAEVLAA